MATKQDQSTPLGKTIRQPGNAPGVLIPDVDAFPTEIHFAVYDSLSLREETSVAVDSLPSLQEGAVLWIDVVGTDSVVALEEIGRRFGVHPLALEDAVNVNQRPKIEAFDNDLFAVVRMCTGDGKIEGATTEQVCILLRRGLVMTFQERPGDCFGRVRERMRVTARRLRTRGADYLAYSLIDAIVDGYQPVLEGLDERVEEVEQRLLDNPQIDDLKLLHVLRRDLISLRRGIAPAREVVLGLMHDSEDGNTVSEETHPFLRDCYDHVIRTVDQIDTFRELCASLMDLYLSSVSNRTNDVMKILTMMSTMFIPLSFMVGLYGMNFNTDSPWNMPELNAAYGYPILVAMMMMIVGGFLIYFKRKGWL